VFVANPRLRHTLWSTATGREVVQDYFLKGESDEARFGIFRRNLLLWEADIGQHVKAWVGENFERWQEEKPEWFRVEKIHDQFLPAGALEQLGSNRKRRGSAARSVRESLRGE
jgi:hypothetical protein